MVNTDRIVVIGGVSFRDVTNETAFGRIFSYQEAYEYTLSRRDSDSNYGWSSDKKA